MLLLLLPLHFSYFRIIFIVSRNCCSSLLHHSSPSKIWLRCDRTKNRIKWININLYDNLLCSSFGIWCVWLSSIWFFSHTHPFVVVVDDVVVVVVRRWIQYSFLSTSFFKYHISMVFFLDIHYGCPKAIFQEIDFRKVIQLNRLKKWLLLFAFKLKANAFFVDLDVCSSCTSTQISYSLSLSPPHCALSPFVHTTKEIWKLS